VKAVMGWLKIFLWILVLSSCTSSPKTNSTTEERYPEEKDTNSPARKSEVHIVEISQMKFQPSEIRVHKGDKVRWINLDITDHDIMEQKTKAWASSRLASGQSWSMVVTQSADYYCNLHQVMKGKIIVE
jgi:plastocyanin